MRPTRLVTALRRGRVDPQFSCQRISHGRDFNSVTHHCWDRIPEESLKGTITRTPDHGERMMIAHVYLKKGDDVPRHHHENES